MIEFNPTHTRIMAVLRDGQPHTRMELFGCLNDDLQSYRNVAVHISKIRKKLRPKGVDILLQKMNGRTHYRLVRLLSKHYDE